MTGASENSFVGVAGIFTATVNDFCSIFSKLKAFLYFVRLYYVSLATKPDMKVTEEGMILFKFSGQFFLQTVVEKRFLLPTVDPNEILFVKSKN